MKKLLILLVLVSGLVSCGEESVVKDQEALQAEALASIEFKAIQAKYEAYNEFKMNGIEELYQQQKNGSLTGKSFEDAQTKYIQSLADQFQEISLETIKFKKKYPSISNLDNENLFNRIVTPEQK